MLYKIHKTDIPKASAVLADAFQHDPLWNKFFKGESTIFSRCGEKKIQKEYKKDHYGGWQTLDEIKDYVDNIQIQDLVQEFKKKFNTGRVILFGSRAYGNPSKESDIDLLIVMETDLSVKQQAFLIRREITSTVPVDIIVRTPAQVDERIKIGDTFTKTAYETGIEL